MAEKRRKKLFYQKICVVFTNERSVLLISFFVYMYIFLGGRGRAFVRILSLIIITYIPQKHNVLLDQIFFIIEKYENN